MRSSPDAIWYAALFRRERSWSRLAFATDFNRVSAQVRSSSAPGLSPFSKRCSPRSMRSLPSKAKSRVSGFRQISKALSIASSSLLSPSIRLRTKSKVALWAGVSSGRMSSTNSAASRYSPASMMAIQSLHPCSTLQVSASSRETGPSFLHLEIKNPGAFGLMISPCLEV